MRPELKRSILLNIAWYSLFLVVLGFLIGWPMARLNQRRSTVASQVLGNAAKRDVLELGSHSEENLVLLDSMQGWMLECEQMAARESLRIAEVAKVAESAGVRLLSMRNLDAGRIEEGQILSYVHELSGRGSYQEIARFLDGLSAARGMTSIDNLSIERDESDPPRTLRASLAVSWHAPSSAMATSEKGL